MNDPMYREDLAEIADQLRKVLRENARTIVATRTCLFCHKPGALEVDKEEHRKWLTGMVIQAAMPTMPIPQREQLISGTHPHCNPWLGGPEENED